MEHDIIKDALLYVLIGCGLLAVLKFVLSEVGDFWKWLKHWKTHVVDLFSGSGTLFLSVRPARSLTRPRKFLIPTALSS
jgi:hypothetical protein